MARVGSRLVCCLMLLVLAAGCRTTQPVLKPPPQPEILTVPPAKDARFDRSQMPEVAFRGMDSRFAKPLDAAAGGGIMPARGVQSGAGMGPGMGGMSGMGGYR